MQSIRRKDEELYDFLKRAREEREEENKSTGRTIGMFVIGLLILSYALRSCESKAEREYHEEYGYDTPMR